MTNQWHVRPGRLRFLRATLFVVLFFLFSVYAEAEVVRFEVLEVESPTFEGREFGSVGRYEKVVARAFLEVDPTDQHNAGVVDLPLVPRNAAERVEFVTDVVILKPVHLAQVTAGSSMRSSTGGENSAWGSSTTRHEVMISPPRPTLETGI